MLVYLDTSCIAKLFLDEPDSSKVRYAVSQAEGLLTSTVSYTEMHSLIARRSREKWLKRGEVKRILSVFESDWAHYGKIPANEPLLRQAARLVAKHPLRSLDAIHLASALSLLPADKKSSFLFLTADHRLEGAARKEKLPVEFP